MADNSSSDLHREPLRATVHGAPRSNATMTAAGLAASAGCVLLVVHLWTDPSSRLLLVLSGLFSLASAVLSFSVLRPRPGSRG